MTVPPSYVLASALAATILVAFALAIDVLANPGGTLEENRNASGPESLAASVWLGGGLTVAMLVLLGLFVARVSGSAKAAALVALPVLPVASLAASSLEGILFPHFYWYFLIPGGWAAYYAWGFVLIAFPVEVAVAALIAAGTAFVFLRLRRRGARRDKG